MTIDGADIIRLHFSGCSASCAQPQIADVGFRGETAKTADAIVEDYESAQLQALKTGLLVAAFLALLWPRLSDRRHQLVAVAAAAVALGLVPLTPAGVPVLAAGAVALLAGTLDRTRVLA